ncbi:MAG: glucose 1-dehydrogenase [Deltaproteobacteria bacterium]|nr:glucose 1-dehydrogenase [Deltaproteobacteria bacterium]MBI2227517.1 glucose 1-dehydrogenase [Deltaproteobacteria bacterium]MBI2367367.1 glucose 1-dehydrogenase [Deltaproteobacteria bacterium]MBI2532044.1 glucose 1-dehydrogenase [Deltaproteobacteria bacterium]MBI3066225.1 glucose 1-dehydrogenase [Deltaproteobacteria bacterium]
MKAVAVTPGKKSVGIIDHPEPRLSSPTDVKLRMIEAGVCGTDKEICAFEYGTPPSGMEQLVIGHESLGEVVEIGAQVTRVKVGDLVVPMVRRPCPHDYCIACRSSRQDFCFTGDFTERGIKEQHGFMAQFVVDDDKYMNPVPEELREVAVLVEPLTIAEKGLAQVWQVQQRLPWGCPVTPGKAAAHCHRAVVLGAGPVGLLGAMALVNYDFDTYVYSREAAPNPKSTLLESIGAKYISSESVAIDELPKIIGNIDLVYEATGASNLSFEMMKYLGTNGIFIFTGVPGRKGPIEVDTDLMMRNLVLKNQVVFGTVNAGRDAFENSIRDVGTFTKRWPEAVKSLITGRFPMEAHRDLLLGRSPGIKNVISLN